MRAELHRLVSEATDEEYAATNKRGLDLLRSITRNPNQPLLRCFTCSSYFLREATRNTHEGTCLLERNSVR